MVRKKALALINSIINFPAFRKSAGKILSVVASRIHQRPITIFYDEVWLRKDGSTVFPIDSYFQLKIYTILGWKANTPDVICQGLEYWFIHYQIRPGDIVVDIGAGKGEDSSLFSQLTGETGAVYAYEAHPATFLCLKKNIEYSQRRNVHLFHGAVFSKKATLQIEDLPSDRWCENSVITTGEKRSRGYFEVPAFPLDDCEPVACLKSIDFLKVNIEGAEVDALIGMKETLKKVRHACIACHDFIGMATRARCKELLLESGFEVFEMPEDVEPWQRDHLHAVRRK